MMGLAMSDGGVMTVGAPDSTLYPPGVLVQIAPEILEQARGLDPVQKVVASFLQEQA